MLLYRRSGKNIYDYVESKKVFKFLTKTEKVSHEEKQPKSRHNREIEKDSVLASIFEGSPKMYRRFGSQLDTYNG